MILLETEAYPFAQKRRVRVDRCTLCKRYTRDLMSGRILQSQNQEETDESSEKSARGQ